MIDPRDVTKFDRTDAETQEFILFCVSVAGKGAKQIASALDRFLNPNDGSLSPYQKLTMTPFEKIRLYIEWGTLRRQLETSRIGKYTKLTNAFTILANCKYDLMSVTTEQLETIPGIGPKTSRYFILHSRPTKNIACLDTHILAWLRDQGHDAPKKSPTGSVYRQWEKVFCEEADKRGKSVAALDLEIWNERNRSYRNVT